MIALYFLRVILSTLWIDKDGDKTSRDVFLYLYFGILFDMETTDVSVSGDIQLEQEGLSGLYDPQVQISRLNTYKRYNSNLQKADLKLSEDWLIFGLNTLVKCKSQSI